jgi:2-hydroxy-3-oxopropionate reductase
MAAQNIGFIGLGDMGFPMARRLLKHGFPVYSCAHRRREAIDSLKSEGLVEKANPFEVAEQADVIISIVLNEAQNDAVLRGETGALGGMKPGSILIVMSTVAPEYCIKLAEEASAHDVTVLDCPVSGGNMGAEKGTLALILGGETDTMERCRSLLEVMGTIYHCGDVGMGQVAKLANNAIAFDLVYVHRAELYHQQLGLCDRRMATHPKSRKKGHWALHRNCESEEHFSTPHRDEVWARLGNLPKRVLV